MNNDILKSFDRNKIKKWLAKLPHEMDMPYNTFDEGPDSAEPEHHDHNSKGRHHNPPQTGSEHAKCLDMLLDKRQLLVQEADPGQNDRQQLHVDDALGLDSTSVFDVRYRIRWAIDEVALEFRGGYY